MSAPRAAPGAGGFSFARHGWLALVVLLSCARPSPESSTAVMRGGAIVKLNDAALTAAIASGEIRDTTSVFHQGRWIPAREHPEVARRLRQETARQEAASRERAVAKVLVINADSPGERIDLAAFRVPGKNVIFDFSSKHCGPCRRMSEQLDLLTTRRADVLVRVVNIDRPGSFGIDWESPVARQYDLQGVPSLRVALPDGSLLDEEKSDRLVYGWLHEAGLLR